MIEVFKTNITEAAIAEKIIAELKLMLPMAKINFDLQGFDNILRVEISTRNTLQLIQQHLHQAGFYCEILE
jgi:hypothetical protein